MCGQSAGVHASVLNVFLQILYARSNACSLAQKDPLVLSASSRVLAHRCPEGNHHSHHVFFWNVSTAECTLQAQSFPCACRSRTRAVQCAMHCSVADAHAAVKPQWTQNILGHPADQPTHLTCRSAKAAHWQLELETPSTQLLLPSPLITANLDRTR